MFWGIFCVYATFINEAPGQYIASRHDPQSTIHLSGQTPLTLITVDNGFILSGCGVNQGISTAASHIDNSHQCRSYIKYIPHSLLKLEFKDAFRDKQFLLRLPECGTSRRD